MVSTFVIISMSHELEGFHCRLTSAPSRVSQDLPASFPASPSSVWDSLVFAILYFRVRCVFIYETEGKVPRPCQHWPPQLTFPPSLGARAWLKESSSTLCTSLCLSRVLMALVGLLSTARVCGGKQVLPLSWGARKQEHIGMLSKGPQAEGQRPEDGERKPGHI